MSIAAIASYWTWSNSTDVSGASSPSHPVTAFEACVTQREQNLSSVTLSTQSLPDQSEGIGGVHDHHQLHGKQNDGGDRNGGSFKQPEPSSQMRDIVGALRGSGSVARSGTTVGSAAPGQSRADASGADVAGGTHMTVSTNALSIPVASTANSLTTVIPQAMAAYSADQAESRNVLVYL